MQRAALETGTWKLRDNTMLCGEFAESRLTTYQIRNTYEHAVAPTFRATRIASITPAVVRRWYGTLPRTGPLPVPMPTESSPRSSAPPSKRE